MLGGIQARQHSRCTTFELEMHLTSESSNQRSRKETFITKLSFYKTHYGDTMHNKMHITQSFSPQSFLANSVPEFTYFKSNWCQ